MRGFASGHSKGAVNRSLYIYLMIAKLLNSWRPFCLGLNVLTNNRVAGGFRRHNSHVVSLQCCHTSACEFIGTWHETSINVMETKWPTRIKGLFRACHFCSKLVSVVLTAYRTKKRPRFYLTTKFRYVYWSLTYGDRNRIASISKAIFPNEFSRTNPLEV